MSSGRAFRLKDGEGAAAGTRRAIEGRADAAAETLREDAADDLAGAVHQARKDLKKLRSLLRLTRSGLGERAYRLENDRYRSAARMLGDARDAEAKLESLAALRDRYGGDFPTRWSLDFVADLERRRDEMGGGEVPAEIAEAAKAIDEGRRSIADRRLSCDGFELFEPGLRRGYRRGRARLADVLEDPTDEAVHEWRKRVKDFWYQLRFLQRVWPPVTEAVFEQARELSSLLGDHHDLAVLRDDVVAAPELFGGNSQRRLLELISRRQRELLDAALPIGRRLYAEKPRRFAERMSAYWRAG